jgi:hypothetical protein
MIFKTFARENWDRRKVGELRSLKKVEELWS